MMPECTTMSARLFTVRLIFWAAMTMLLCLPGSAFAAGTIPRILVLNSYNIGYDWSDAEIQGLRTGLSTSFTRYELFTEHLDTKAFPDKRHFPRLADLLEAKYRDARLNVIIAMDNGALEFTTRYRERLFPGIPVVFCGINDYKPSLIAGQKQITGVAEYHDLSGTLALALGFHPRTREVRVIHDYTDSGLAMRHELEAAAPGFPQVKLHFQEEGSLEETLKGIKLLPADSLILIAAYTVDKEGRAFTMAEAARLISDASPVPVYSVHGEQLGNGVVGGRMMEGEAQGRKAAELAVRILTGKNADDLPVITQNLSHAQLDYDVLRTYGIAAAKLPADAVVINKPLPTYAVGKTTFWSAAFFTLFTSLGMIVLVQNIRRRKNLENFQRAILDGAVYAIITTGVDGVITSINPAAERLLGYSADELIGKQYPTLFHLAEEIDARAAELSLRYNESVVGFEAFTAPSLHGDVNQHNWTYVRKDGSHVAVSLDITVMREDMGRIVGYMGFAGDISEQRRLEEQIRQQRKMESIGLLAGGIAHDFNNMLTPIVGYSEMIRNGFAAHEPVHKHASAILEAAGKAHDLVRQLLSFSRKQILAMHLHDLNLIIASFSDILQRTIRENIVIRQDLSATACPVKADRTQMEQILLNLAVNAQDAIHGNGFITIGTGQAILDDEYCQLHSGARPGQYVMLTVADSGNGMDTATISRIFEPFFTTKGVGKGTGLGLSTVYGIVQQHDGHIDVRSTPGTGTIFRIYLPLAADDGNQKIQASPDAGAVPIRGNATILLVEDNKIVMDMTRELLEKSGYIVLSASLPHDAVAITREHQGHINLLLSDVVMPQMNGPELHSCLKEFVPDLPVLYMSGYTGNAVVTTSAPEGTTACITKPFTSETLLNGVLATIHGKNPDTFQENPAAGTDGITPKFSTGSIMHTPLHGSSDNS